MTASVPGSPGPVPTQPVQGGRPVSSQTWMSSAALTNYLLGRGATVVPAHYVPLASGIAAASAQDLRYYTNLQPATVALLWILRLRSLDGSARSTQCTLQAPYGSGTTQTVTVGAARDGTMITYLEPRAAHASAVGEIGIRITPTTYAIDVESISCLALPRSELSRDTVDYGMDGSTCTPRQPIYSATAGSGTSLAEAGRRGVIALSAARRVGLLQLGLPTNTTDAANVTTGKNGLTYAHGSILGRKLLRGSTTANVTVYALAWAVGASTYGRLYVNTTSGGTDVQIVNLGTGGTPLTGTPTWYAGAGTFPVNCEDLTTSDGLPPVSSWDEVTFNADRQGGAGTIYIASVSCFEV